ncbi:MAG: 2,3-bisphosphoglycerate-dependent phosphoglycerate mutase [Alphaproteobacteria bacterium MarineAlpha5_Bin9]|nr:MAG: 2,3-bisphosphoglycerate-dependent phosphoglycerate mutase [Alphaproteobacteria bacterium MarineAlpha5_Bin9]|tara:strand:+ start:62 stop:622 length:561 start_codon:yes stop_codon:yes gene_type:complete
MNKEIYLIRHGQSEANVALDLDNPNFYYDAKLTAIGKKQAQNAQKKLKNIDFDLMLCSPLTRALQTFSLIFPNLVQDALILPFTREHCLCSSEVGKQPAILQKEFPNFHFGKLKNFWWNNDIPINEKKIIFESMEDLDKRVLMFKNWIKKRPEKRIALVSHGTFISRIINYLLDNCEFEIWHPDND